MTKQKTYHYRYVFLDNIALVKTYKSSDEAQAMLSPSHSSPRGRSRAQLKKRRLSNAKVSAAINPLMHASTKLAAQS